MDPNVKYLERLIALLSEAFSPAYKTVMDWLSTPETYYQALFVLVMLGLAFGLTTFFRHVFDAIKEPDNNVRTFSRHWYMQRSGRLVFPLLAILFLSFSEPLLRHFINHFEVLHAALRVAYVWFLWVALRAFVTNTIVRTVGIWILLPATLLQLFGWFSTVVKHLEEYGFKLGDVEITAYTFLKAIFFVCIIFWIGKIIGNGAEGYIRSNQSLNRATKELLIKIFDIILYTILFLITLNLIGIDLTALAVFSGALGVGLGFGLQKIASNFISGIILLTEKSININNLIEMNDGISGYVRKLGARASVVETFDGKEVMVPNEDFITSRVANLTHSSTKGRIEICVGVSYDSDLHKVYKLILAAAKDYDAAVQGEEDFKPQCFLREYGDSSVNFLLTFWLDDVTKGRWRAKSDVMFKIWDSFKEHGIEIPFPQRDLHIKSGLGQLMKQKPLPEEEEDFEEAEAVEESGSDVSSGD